MRPMESGGWNLKSTVNVSIATTRGLGRASNQIIRRNSKGTLQNKVNEPGRALAPGRLVCIGTTVAVVTAEAGHYQALFSLLRRRTQGEADLPTRPLL